MPLTRYDTYPRFVGTLSFSSILNLAACNKCSIRQSQMTRGRSFVWQPSLPVLFTLWSTISAELLIKARVTLHDQSAEGMRM